MLCKKTKCHMYSNDATSARRKNVEKRQPSCANICCNFWSCNKAASSSKPTGGFIQKKFAELQAGGFAMSETGGFRCDWPLKKAEVEILGSTWKFMEKLNNDLVKFSQFPNLRFLCFFLSHVWSCLDDSPYGFAPKWHIYIYLPRIFFASAMLFNMTWGYLGTISPP